jgi:hypothetical protein
MGKVKNLLLNFLNNLEERLSDKVKTLQDKVDSFPQEEEKIPSELSEEECLLINTLSQESNSKILKSLDYKTYLLLSILPEIKIEEDEPKASLDIFITEPVLMENWLEHFSNLNRIKQFQALIKHPKILSGRYLSESNGTNRRNIKCLRDLPLLKQTLN